VLLLDVLANARLIVKTLIEDKAEIEVAHEALIRYWERLRGWLNEDRDKLRLRESVGEGAKEWEKAGRDEHLLNHRGGRLDDALLLGNNPRYGLTALEQEYLNECAALRNREQLARESRLRRTLAATFAALVIFLALGVFAWTQRNDAQYQASVAQVNAEAAQANAEAARINAEAARKAQGEAETAQGEAERQADRALAGSLTAQSNSIKGSDHALALLLGVEAYQREENLLTRATLFQLLEFSPYTRLFGYNAPVNSVAVSPDGKMIASASCREYSASQCKYGDIVLSDALTGQPLAKLSGDYGIVSSLTFHQSDRLLLAAGGCVPVDAQYKGCTDYRGQITLWDVANTALLADLRSRHTGLVKTIAVSHDGALLASGSFDTTIMLWNISDPSKPAGVGDSLAGHASFVNGLAFSADDQTLVSAGDDKRIILWDVSQPTVAVQIGEPIVEHTAPINSIAFSADGAKFASAGDDKTVVLWNWDSTSRSLLEPLKLAAHEGYVRSVAFSADGKILASAGFDNKAILWNVSAGEQIGLPLNVHVRAINAVTFGTADSGEYLFTGSDDHTVIQWNLSTRQPLSQPLKKISPPQEIGITATNGDLKASVVDGQNIQISGRAELLSGHTGAINSLSFSPKIDGRLLLASASDDQTVILWDVTDVSAAAVFLKLESFDSPVSAAYFDNARLITIEKNGRGVLWNVTPSAWLPLACGAARRNLTPLEWEHFLPNQKYRKTCAANP
jgi:WD40 repeat protein